MSHILVVEDEEHLAFGIKFNLEAEGHAVTMAGDGQLALERMAAAIPPAWDVPQMDAQPHCVQIDFAIVHNTDGSLDGRVVELTVGIRLERQRLRLRVAHREHDGRLRAALDLGLVRVGIRGCAGDPRLAGCAGG